MTLTVNNKADDTSEVMLYGQIGMSFWEDGISAKAFRDAVKACKGKMMNLRINSPGGSTVEASAMVQCLDEYRGSGKRVEVDVDGLAASAASYIACCGDVTRMASNALLMIHNPMGMALGGAEDCRKLADLLDKVKGQILDTYERKATLSRDQLSAAMDTETWYTGKEAVDAGLADSCGPPVQVAAFAGLAELLAKLGYKHTPKLPEDSAAWEETRRRKAIAAKLTA